MTNSNACSAGGAEARLRLANCPDYYLHNGGRADYVQCTSCSLVQQHPLPTDVGALYQDYPVHSSRNALQRLARRIFHRQVYFRPTHEFPNGTLLDYGCGDGTFLREMQHEFASACGFEPVHTHAAALSRQLDVPIYSSTAQLRAERAGAMNVVTAHFVLEHANDLHDAFNTFSAVLKPGGLLHIAVPNISSWEARLFKKRWHGLDPPRHLVFPEAVHLKTLARDYGFSALHVSFAAFPNTLAASLATALSGRCQSALLLGFILPCWLVVLAAPQGTLIIQMTKD